MPARIISLWLATSASAGASFRVEMKNWEALMGQKQAREHHGGGAGGLRIEIGTGTWDIRGYLPRQPGAIMIST
jgi:hypothetical protein